MIDEDVVRVLYAILKLYKGGSEEEKETNGDVITHLFFTCSAVSQDINMHLKTQAEDEDAMGRQALIQS